MPRAFLSAEVCLSACIGGCDTQCQVLGTLWRAGGEVPSTPPALPPNPGKASQGEPPRKEDSHEMGLTVAFGVT